ncbi:MAG: chromosomal replication initiator protein DnaA [Thermodesulfobacteriota bacterium]
MEEIWSAVLKYLNDKVTQDAYHVWIEPIIPLSLTEQFIEVRVPNKFFEDWLTQNYLPLIKEALLHALARDCDVIFKLKKNPVLQTRTNRISPIDKSDTLRNSPFNKNYTFDNFVIGASNQFANAACQAVATLPAKNYNPLFIYGGVGLGKTHLLNAIGNYVLQNGIIQDLSKIRYLSAEQFTNELINSIRYEKMDKFRDKFRSMNILLIDDIQFIAGKERTQAEFFHTFNSLYEARKQIVVTSDKFPRDITDFEERLRSRFEWGLIADIQPPDIETKVAILKKKAQVQDISLPNPVAFFLASNASSNIRVLEGSLIRIIAFSKLTQTDITLDLAKDVLKNIIKTEGQPVSIESIQKALASHFNLKISDLKGKRKTNQIVFARQIAMYLARKLTKSSLVEIGDRFGGRDHSTVLHAINKIKQQIEANQKIVGIIQKIESKIKTIL